MKKLLAILTVMCMVLTTIIVPTVAFGNEEVSPELTGFSILGNETGSVIEQNLDKTEDLTFSVSLENSTNIAEVIVNLSGIKDTGGEHNTGIFLEKTQTDGHYQWTDSFEDMGIPEGEWCVKNVVVKDSDSKEYTFTTVDNGNLSDWHFLVGIEAPITFEYSVNFQVPVELDEDEDYPYEYTVTTGTRTSISGMKTAENTFIVPTVGNVVVGEETAEFRGWYYNNGEDNYVDENDTIIVTSGDNIYFYPWYSMLVVETSVGYLDEEGNSCQDDIVILLEEGSTVENLLEEVTAMYASKHSVSAEFTGEWTFDAEEMEETDVITPDMNWIGLTANYENGEVNYDDIYGGDDDDADEDGDSDGIPFNVWFNTDGGYITFDYIDQDGNTQTVDICQVMPNVCPTGSSLWDSIKSTGIVNFEKTVVKPNAVFLGWKLYACATCDVLQDRDGNGTPDGYVESTDKTLVPIDEWSFGDDGPYETYLYMDLTEIKGDDTNSQALFSTDDLMDVELTDGIYGYYAVAQWKDTLVNTQNIIDSNVDKVINMVSDDIISKAAGESGTTADSIEDEAVIQWIKETLEESVNNLINSGSSANISDASLIDFHEIAVTDLNGNKIENAKIPEEGIAVTIPYPENIKAEDVEDYEFVIMHMLSSGTDAGQTQIEKILDMNEDGFVVAVKSLSPFAVAYQETSNNSQGGEGTTGGSNDSTQSNTPGTTGGATTGTTAAPDKAVDTGDDFSAIPFIVVMMIAVAGVAAALFRRRAE